MPTSDTDQTPDLMETLKRFESGHKRQSMDELRACFHDDALLESVASEGNALGADETAEALRSASGDGIYSIGDWQYEEIAPDVVVSSKGARHRLPGGRGTSHENVFRLTVGRDGLMWRVKFFRSRAEALAHLDPHGPGLGL